MLKTEKIFDTIKNSPTIDLGAREGSDFLSLQVLAEIRKRVIITINEVTLDLKEDIENPDEFMGQLVGFLNALDGQRKRVQKRTTEGIARESHFNTCLEFIPEKCIPTFIRIIKFGLSIQFILEFKSPFIKKAFEKEIGDALLLMALRKRLLHELQKLQKTYQTLTTIPSEKLQIITTLLGNAVDTLIPLINSAENMIHSDVRIYSKIFPQ